MEHWLKKILTLILNRIENEANVPSVQPYRNFALCEKSLSISSRVNVICTLLVFSLKVKVDSLFIIRVPKPNTKLLDEEISFLHDLSNNCTPFLPCWPISFLLESVRKFRLLPNVCGCFESGITEMLKFSNVAKIV